MHNVDNLGSVLQAYALQHIIDTLGHEAEIIDYRFYKPSKKSLFSSVILFLLNCLMGFPKKRVNKKISLFRKKLFKLSDHVYTRETIFEMHNDYDIYCTGSDQVWNPRYIKNDTSFMLDFAPDDKPKISFAASFATDLIPKEYECLYKKYLSRYDKITVRESAGVEIVRNLTGYTPKVVCDPTLLLTASEWNSIAEEPSRKMPEKYILVYLLGYMFDPRPGFYNIIKTVQQSLKLPVYFVNGWIHDMKQPNGTLLNGVGPEEFVSLISKATFVITDSFHGTAFATIFERPMLGVVKDANAGDGRLATLLRVVENENALLQYDKEIVFRNCDINNYIGVPEKLTEFREKSILVLRNILL